MSYLSPSAYLPGVPFTSNPGNIFAPSLSRAYGVMFILTTPGRVGSIVWRMPEIDDNNTATSTGNLGIYRMDSSGNFQQIDLLGPFSGHANITVVYDTLLPPGLYMIAAKYTAFPVGLGTVKQYTGYSVPLEFGRRFDYVDEPLPQTFNPSFGYEATSVLTRIIMGGYA